MYKHKINVVFNGMKYERMKGCSILRLSTFSYGPIISEMPHYIFFLLVNIVFTMQILLHTLNLKNAIRFYIITIRWGTMVFFSVGLIRRE